VFDADIALSPIMQPDEQVADIICSLRDISERKQLEKQLRRMLDREMEISEMRSRFISMAAHDLRNPLAVIKTSAGLLAKYRNQLSDEQQHEKYDRIQSSINVMIDLLDDILTIGRVEAGKLSFQPEEFDLREFCEALVSEVSAVTGASQEIVFVAPEKCSAVVMDRKLIRHIISNLLSNAVKYSPDDSPIRFGLSCDGNYVVFRVEDQGIGIPLADQQRLFEAFHRARNVGQVAGTGLGLTIVKQSAELHGGTIQFTSAENVGTTFTVRIPYVIARGQTE
jgi:signal transduction histidine kinase